MPDSSLTQSAKEAYARARAADVFLQTIEITHPSQNLDSALGPYYLVRATQPYELTLENSQTVTFEPSGFRLQPPSQDDQGVTALTVEFDNVDLRIGKFFEACRNYDEVATVKYRTFLASDTSQPLTSSPLALTLSQAKIDLFKVTGRASFVDIVNLKFLTEKYTRDRFNALGNS